MRLFGLSADNGTNDGRVELGLCFKEGTGVERNPAEAVPLFKLSANAGGKDGLAQLGLCLLDGVGTEQNMGKSVALFQRAAESGNIYMDRFYWELSCWKREGVSVNREQVMLFFSTGSEQLSLTTIELNNGENRGVRRDAVREWTPPPTMRRQGGLNFWPEIEGKGSVQNSVLPNRGAGPL